MKAIFLFDGGNYKRGIDSGRSRVPLTPEEAEMIFYDPDLAGDAPSSIGAELNMSKYRSQLCNLEVGDEIFMGVVPDAALYRAIWMMSFDAVTGLTADLDLVSISDVWDAFEAGTATGVPGVTDVTAIQYDFANGLGDATKDAEMKVKLIGGVHSDYRNPNALQVQPTENPVVAGLGQSMYFRLTITAVGEFGGNPDTSCCASCNKEDYPTFQVGAVYDRLAVDKQRVRDFCNCSEPLCDEGCGQVADTPPVVGTEPTVVLSALLAANVITLDVQFDQDVINFDETDVDTTFVHGGPATLDFNNIVVISPSLYRLTYDVTNDDGSGGQADFVVPAASANAIVGGLDNTISNTEIVVIIGF